MATISGKAYPLTEEMVATMRDQGILIQEPGEEMDKPRAIIGGLVGWRRESDEYEIISISIPKADADYIKKNCDIHTYFVLMLAESANTCERVVGCEIAEK